IELAGERRARRLQQRGELRSLRGRRVEPRGERPQRFHRRRDRERLAHPVDDPAAMRRNLELAAVARAAFLLPARLVEALQAQRARREHAEGERERAEYDRRAEPRQRGCGCSPHRSPPPRTISTREGGGSSMPSEPRAIFSTRAGMAHVDCSSWSCPYSVS